jgi:hypothetical protein
MYYVQLGLLGKVSKILILKSYAFYSNNLMEYVLLQTRTEVVHIFYTKIKLAQGAIAYQRKKIRTLLIFLLFTLKRLLRVRYGRGQ